MSCVWRQDPESLDVPCDIWNLLFDRIHEQNTIAILEKKFSNDPEFMDYCSREPKRSHIPQQNPYITWHILQCVNMFIQTCGNLRLVCKNAYRSYVSYQIWPILADCVYISAMDSQTKVSYFSGLSKIMFLNMFFKTDIRPKRDDTKGEPVDNPFLIRSRSSLENLQPNSLMINTIDKGDFFNTKEIKKMASISKLKPINFYYTQ